MSRVNPRIVYWQREIYAAVRKGKLTLQQGAVLIYIATDKLDYETGAGTFSQQEVADELSVSRSLVVDACVKAQRLRPQLMERTKKGGATSPKSEWQVIYPEWEGHRQSSPRATLKAAQSSPGATLKQDQSSRQSSRAKPQSSPGATLRSLITEPQSLPQERTLLELAREQVPDIEEETIDALLNRYRDNPAVQQAERVLMAAIKEGRLQAELDNHNLGSPFLVGADGSRGVRGSLGEWWPI